MSITNNITLQDKILSLSYHLTKVCNFKCRFCYAHFNKVEKNHLSEKEAKKIINLLYKSGTRKITFAGGEPTLINYLPKLIIYASNLGMTTVLITNGYKITQSYLDLMDNKLDWVGLSIDSGIEEINIRLGRGTGGHVERSLRVADLLEKNDIIIKLNTVVTSLTWNEDMNWLVDKVNPKRWKVFQILPILGENDDAADMIVTPKQYTHFTEVHKKNNPVIERNENMKGGYVMIDPEGRFFNNDTGILTHGPSILDVGVEKAFEFSTFSYSTFLGREGNYKWD
ncbi:MAG: Anaerobic sulfatase-maturating enzyme [Candidatus Heimdallarchaeota archaeon LC_3]|nr:MAG: Anaerobic sulfatase-maturating enzyme [Candidatus Heimdallarchaeota archaeon LC_3]